jgi:hypothetical protein
MADDVPTDGLWNWSAAGRQEPAQVRAAIAGVLQKPVAELGGIIDVDEILCDVWHVGGDFPTLIDCYLVPRLSRFSAPSDGPGVAEATIASAVAVRLGTDILLPDDTLNPTRYVLAEPNGTLRVVHVDERETDDGTERRHVRPCTGADPACAIAPERHAA